MGMESMRDKEFIGEWTVDDNQLIDMFEHFKEYLIEGADEKELERLNQFLINNQTISDAKVGMQYYPVSFNALLTTVDPSTPALITIARFDDSRTLDDMVRDYYVFDGLKFANNGINGGFLKRTMLFESEQHWQEFFTLFLLGFSSNDWKIREKIL